MMKTYCTHLPTARAYLSIFRIKTAEGLQYRIAGLAGASISIFYTFIEITVFTVFYRYADHASAGILAGLTLRQLITYTWLGQILFLMQPMSIDSDILSKIVSGDVGVEMCRPLDLYYHWFAKIAAGRLVPLFWRGSIILLVGLLMPPAFRLKPPASMAGLLYMLLSFISAFLLCTAYGTFVCVIRLNITWGNGPTYIIMLIGGVLSGGYLPLQLWPEFLQDFLLFQPFAGYLDIPVRLYLGTLAPDNALWAVGLQLLWTFAFLLLGRRIMALRLRKITVQGG
jgi:ABC-2 type transport system permease protein